MENILIDKCTFYDVSSDNLILKRFFDITVSAIALLILSPVFLIVALLILLDSKGPSFFLKPELENKAKSLKCGNSVQCMLTQKHVKPH